MIDPAKAAKTKTSITTRPSLSPAEVRIPTRPNSASTMYETIFNVWLTMTAAACFPGDTLTTSTHSLAPWNSPNHPSKLQGKRVFVLSWARRTPGHEQESQAVEEEYIVYLSFKELNHELTPLTCKPRHRDAI